MGRKPKPQDEMSDRELAILEAAVQVIGEKGFSAATTSEIARTAGVAEGTIFRYFKTKKDILHGIILRLLSVMGEKIVLNSIEELLRDGINRPLRDVLKDIAKDRHALARRIFPMAKIMLTEAIYHEDIRNAAIEHLYKPASRMFEQFYKTLAEQGKVRKDLEWNLVFTTCASLVGGSILSANVLPVEDKEAFFERMTDAAIDILLRGIEVR